MLDKHIRIVALQCNFQTEEETLAMPERWHEIGFNAEQLFHTHADLYSAVYDPARHRALFKKYLDNSRDNGIKTIVYMNVHILGPSLQDHAGEWGTVKEDGTPCLHYLTYPGCCVNSGWRDYLYGCLESMKEFDIEGFFFDGPTYTQCYCPHCQARFMEKYGKPMAQGTKAELKAFLKDKVYAFKKELTEKVKSINPNWMAYFNEGLQAGHLDAEEMEKTLKVDDLIGTEGGFFFFAEPRTIPTWKCAVAAKLAEAVAGDKPTVIFFAGDHKPWGWFMHTDSELRLCYASALGNGASVWFGMHHRPDSLKMHSGEAVREMVQFDKAHDDLYQNTRSVAETAIFYSYNTAAYYAKSSEESDLYGSQERVTSNPGNYTDAFQGAVAALEHLSMPYDIVTDLHPAEMSKYKLLLVPGAAMLNDASLDAMRRFVEEGGRLVADGEFGFYDGKGRACAGDAVRELTGAVHVGPWYEMMDFNYFSVNDAEFPNDNAFGYLPAPKWCGKVEILSGAEVAAMMPEPLKGRYSGRPGKPEIPVASFKRHGKGSVLWFAGGLFEFYGRYQIHAVRNWFRHLIDKCGLQYRLVGARPGVSMSVRRTQAGGTLVHLTNFNGFTRPMDSVLPVRGLKLSMPAEITSGTDLRSGKKLDRDEAGAFILPELNEYGVFLLD